MRSIRVHMTIPPAMEDVAALIAHADGMEGVSAAKVGHISGYLVPEVLFVVADINPPNPRRQLVQRGVPCL